MKKYRIVYQLNSITTEWYVRADNEKDAEKKFRDLKGNNVKIINIEEAY